MASLYDQDFHARAIKRAELLKAGELGRLDAQPG